MTTATLSFFRLQKSLKAKIGSADLPIINWRKFCVIGFFASLALVVFYVWQINDLTKGYYTINSYEKQISAASDENKNLEVSFAESSFLGEALVKIQALNFQKVTPVKYIQILDNSAEAAKANKNI